MSAVAEGEREARAARGMMADMELALVAQVAAAGMAAKSGFSAAYCSRQPIRVAPESAEVSAVRAVCPHLGAGDMPLIPLRPVPTARVPR